MAVLEPVHDDQARQQWQIVRNKLRGEFGEAAYNSWLKPLSLNEIGPNRVRVAVPTRFMRDWVDSNYRARLLSLWQQEDPAIDRIEVIVAPQAPARDGAHRDGAHRDGSHRDGSHRGGAHRGGDAGSRPATQPAPGTTPPAAPPAASGSGSESVDVGAPLDSRFSFDNFVVGRSNELAHAAARRVAESDEAPFNPLFLYGGVGLGKTHLMHAMAWHISHRQNKRRVLYMSAEKFMYQFIRALRFKTTMDFKEQFRSVDVLMIDDIQFIGRKDSTQEEFFHTFNALVDRNRQIVVSADKSPSDIGGLEERLKSRLGWGLVADIHPTDYELRLGILQSKTEQLHVAIPPRLLEFLAHKITANIRELEGALNRIVAHATLVGRPVSLESAQEALRDLLRANERTVTIDEIQKRVAEHFNIRLADMHSARRARAVARPRQVAMFLAKSLTAHSLPDIGRKFGGRDHTTVMHAVRKVEELRAADPGFREDIDMLQRMLESGPRPSR